MMWTAAGAFVLGVLVGHLMHRRPRHWDKICRDCGKKFSYGSRADRRKLCNRCLQSKLDAYGKLPEVIRLGTVEEVRDAMAQGYGVSTPGSLWLPSDGVAPESAWPIKDEEWLDREWPSVADARKG